MKKQLLNLSIAFAATLISVAAMASGTSTIKKMAEGCAPTIDGQMSDFIWENVTPVTINVTDSAFGKQAGAPEVPTILSAKWLGVWNDTAIFVFVNVTEAQVFCPSWISGLNDYLSDKIELYFDVNAVKKDGVGASGGNGNWQVAPNYQQAADFGEVGSWNTTGSKPVLFSSTYDSVNAASFRNMEYSVPFTTLTTNATDNPAYNPTSQDVIGFDVSIADFDAGADEGLRYRVGWSNNTADPNNWGNMDEVGDLTLSTDEVTCLDINAVNTVTVDQSVVYPTIVSDILNVTVDGTVEIFNSLGQRVMVSTENRINVSSLTKGVYFAKVNNITAKFIKE